LDHPNAQESGGRYKEADGPLAPDIFEGGIKLPAGVGVQRLNLQAHGASSSFHIPKRRLSAAYLGGIQQNCDACNPGHKLTQKFQPLCHQLGR
jgi:hypothetical protein